MLRERSWAYPGSNWTRPPAEIPCEPVLTFKRRSNKVFHIRCKCQAQTAGVPSSRYFMYDWLHEGSAEECLAAYQRHLAEKAAA